MIVRVPFTGQGIGFGEGVGDSFGEDRDGRLRCHYFEASRCRSCTLIETPYAQQLRDKEQRCRELLPAVPTSAWLPPFSGGDRGFRNRVKLVVGGTAGAVTLGIQGPDGRGVDLRECAIQAPEIAAVIPAIASFLDSTGLAPYDVPARRGELKFVHVTVAPPGEDGVAPLMLRIVGRTQHTLDVVRARLDSLRAAVPHAVVISVNLLPEHKAVLEGEREELLLGSSLPMRLGFDERQLTLHLMPQSFFQTNTSVARALYTQVAEWVLRERPSSLWDLYCGVGGFALHCAAALSGENDEKDCRVLGVELSGAAIDSARRSSREAKLGAEFLAADATRFAVTAPPESLPELLIVNPPRRGIGDELSNWIEGSGIAHLVYSSCNPVSLARDLSSMPSYAVREGRVFDMFPYTSHLEIAVLLERVQ